MSSDSLGPPQDTQRLTLLYDGTAWGAYASTTCPDIGGNTFPSCWYRTYDVVTAQSTNVFRALVPRAASNNARTPRQPTSETANLFFPTLEELLKEARQQ